MKKLILIFLLFSLSQLSAQIVLPHPYNLDFEIGEIGKIPKGWIVPRYADKLGYIAFLTYDKPKKNRFCLELNSTGEYKDGRYGSVMQSIDAKPYRNKTVRFRAAVRAEIHSPIGSAHLWIKERLADDDETGLFVYDPMQPIVSNEWDYYELTGKISPDAEIINFGLLLFGSGRAWIDDATFEIIDDTLNDLEPPKVLSETELQNINIFSNIYGLIRYFYPSEASLKIDWDKFALYALKKTIYIHSLDSLFNELLKLFRPIAPNLHIVSYDSINLVKFPKYLNAIPNILLCWRHNGIPSINSSTIIGSEIINIYKPQRKTSGSIQQLIIGSNLRDSLVSFSIYARGFLEKPVGKLFLLMRFEDTLFQSISSKFTEIENLSETNWQKFEIKAKVPSNTKFIKTAIILVGEGNIFCDSAHFSTANSENNLLKNPSFEMEKEELPIFGWKITDNTNQSSYIIRTTTDIKLSGQKSLNIQSDEESKIILPKENDFFWTKLDSHSVAVIPAILQTDSTGTLPHSSLNPFENELQNIEYNINDRISKLATLVVLKNLIQHFNLYCGTSESLDLAFFTSLRECSTSKNLYQFHRALQKFLHNVKDNQLRLWNKYFENDRAFPFQFKNLNSKYIITAVSDKSSGIDTGDIIVSINSTPIERFIDSISIYLSYSNQKWRNLKASVFIRYSLDIDTLTLVLIKSNGRVFKTQLYKNSTPNELIELRPPAIAKLNQSTIYIDLTRVNDSQLKEKLDSLPPINNFIFDLRGFVLTSEYFLGYFLQQPLISPKWLIPVFTYPNKLKISWLKINSIIKPLNRFTGANLLFLTDERTVGIAETIAEIVKRNKLGKLIGFETGGNASEAITIPLPSGFFMTMSVIKAFNYNDEEIYSKGIQPTIPVITEENIISLSQDLILQKALSLICN